MTFKICKGHCTRRLISSSAWAPVAGDYLRFCVCFLASYTLALAGEHEDVEEVEDAAAPAACWAKFRQLRSSHEHSHAQDTSARPFMRATID